MDQQQAGGGLVLNLGPQEVCVGGGLVPPAEAHAAEAVRRPGPLRPPCAGPADVGNPQLTQLVPC